jgi:HD-like signal output (HDOD) protein
MDLKQWHERLERPGALPALPEALVAIQSEFYREQPDVVRLCEELQRDPALVSDILKTINSPLFGLRRKVESLKQAVVLLGLRRVRATILTQSLRQSLQTYHSPGFDAFHWWDRSLLMAVSAATLAQRSAPRQVEEAYLTGLLAELGILVLARFEPGYEQVLRQYADSACHDLLEVEKRHFGIDHADLAAAVFEKWHLPEEVVYAALHHHDSGVTDDAESGFLPRAVYFASLLTDCVVTERDDLCGQLTRLAAKGFRIDRPDLFELVNECLSRYRVSASELGLAALVDRKVPQPLAASA